MRCTEPEGEASAKVAAPLGEIQPLPQVMGCAEECWLKRAAMLEPCRLLPSTDAKTDDCSPPTADDRTGFWRKIYIVQHKCIHTAAAKKKLFCMLMKHNEIKCSGCVCNYYCCKRL